MELDQLRLELALMKKEVPESTHRSRVNLLLHHMGYRPSAPCTYRPPCVFTETEVGDIIEELQQREVGATAEVELSSTMTDNEPSNLTKVGVFLGGFALTIVLIKVCLVRRKSTYKTNATAPLL